MRNQSSAIMVFQALYEKLKNGNEQNEKQNESKNEINEKNPQQNKRRQNVSPRHRTCIILEANAIMETDIP